MERFIAVAMAAVMTTAALIAWWNTGEETLNSPFNFEKVLKDITVSLTGIFLRPDVASPEIRSLHF